MPKSVASPRAMSSNIAQLSSRAILEHEKFGRSRSLGHSLLREGVVSAQDMVQTLQKFEAKQARLSDALLAQKKFSTDVLYQAASKHWGVGSAQDLMRDIDLRLVDQFGIIECLKYCILPWRSSGAQTVIVVADPNTFNTHKTALTESFGPICMAVAAQSTIEAVLLQVRGARLVKLAETSVTEKQSCRSFDTGRFRFVLAGAAMVLGFGLLLNAPLVLGILTGIALASMVAFTSLKLFACLARREFNPQKKAPDIAVLNLPCVSVMVALYKESSIAPKLVRRLAKLDYPRDRLDIVLVVEQEDTQTRQALDQTELPIWFRVVVVPNGSVKTKPRALNFALDQCRGSIVGIYDAEDAPEPSQIRKVVQRFHESPADVACLQGILDFYNPQTNWISRCFTIEYAAWFRVFLPGIARLGLAVPLGGTTLFFRREALEKLGRWDAFNVTEDADLGMRIARHGMRTALIETITEEEANCRTWPWIKQRSRWIKGFMMTWATHMRDPVTLWRDLGPRQFLGFQVLLLGSILQQLLAPLLWSFWVMPFGVYHPIQAILPHAALMAMMILFFVAEATVLAIGVLALRKTKHRLSAAWVPTLMFYHPLATVSAYKALWEMITRPFYWDKTSHGHFDESKSKG